MNQFQYEQTHIDNKIVIMAKEELKFEKKKFYTSNYTLLEYKRFILVKGNIIGKLIDFEPEAKLRKLN